MPGTVLEDMETDFEEEDELSLHIYGKRQPYNADENELQDYLSKPRVRFNVKEKENKENKNKENSLK